MNDRWEYTWETTGPKEPRLPVEKLNRLGQDGWRLVAVQPHPRNGYDNGSTFYFVREVEASYRQPASGEPR